MQIYPPEKRMRGRTVGRLDGRILLRTSFAGYRWSSGASYAVGKTPPWQVHDRVLRAFELARDGRGRRA